MSGYEVLESGDPSQWRSYLGGFRPQTVRQGRRVIDHELNSEFIGMTLNSYEPGEEAVLICSKLAERDYSEVSPKPSYLEYLM